ncbi:MAG TPA: DUF1559 domain-containing protein [Pirellulales bacterium]|nr:DUF1559 domain-containing protein [Pirellulales bacterium]
MGCRAPEHRRSPHRGLTVIEVLVAISVIGLLVSLLLPAVAAALASARRVQCHDHLRQLAVAAASYQSTRGVFPYTMVGMNGVGTPVRSISPHALLLPYLELEPVYARITFDEPGATSAGKPSTKVNAPLLALSVAVFLCPDDKVVPGANSYRANMGVTPSPLIRVGSSIVGLATEEDTGAFRVNRALAPAAFADGLSNTVMFSEKLLGGLNPSRFDPPRDCFYSPFQIEAIDDAVLACQNPPSANPPHDAFCGTTWLFGGFDQTWYNHILAPNTWIPDCASDGPGGHGAYSARSFHARAVNAAFADGAVHCINENVDLSVWRAIGTRAGREAVPNDF